MNFNNIEKIIINYNEKNTTKKNEKKNIYTEININERNKNEILKFLKELYKYYTKKSISDFSIIDFSKESAKRIYFYYIDNKTNKMVKIEHDEKNNNTEIFDRVYEITTIDKGIEHFMERIKRIRVNKDIENLIIDFFKEYINIVKKYHKSLIYYIKTLNNFSIKIKLCLDDIVKIFCRIDEHDKEIYFFMKKKT